MVRKKNHHHRKPKKSGPLNGKLGYHPFVELTTPEQEANGVTYFTRPLDYHQEAIRRGLFTPASTACEVEQPPFELDPEALVYCWEPDPKELEIMRKHLAKSPLPTHTVDLFAEPAKLVVDWTLGKTTPIMDASIPDITPRFPVVMNGKYHTDEENLDMSYSLGLLGRYFGEAVTLPNVPTAQVSAEEIIADLKELVRNHTAPRS